jgi:hypothetical protein
MFHRTVFVLIISMCLGAMAAVVLSADALTAPTSLQYNPTMTTDPPSAAVFDTPLNRLPRTIYPAR